METRIRTGDKVVITATDAYYAFIDGWRGSVTGWHSGLAIVEVFHEGIKKQFYVPPEQLQLTIGDIGHGHHD